MKNPATASTQRFLLYFNNVGAAVDLQVAASWAELPP